MIHKVLMIIPTNTSGGAERVLCLLANRFASKGIEVTLLNFDTESAFYHIDDSVKWVKMHLEFKSKNKILKIFEGVFREIERYIYIHKEIKREKPDIVMPFLEMAEVLTIPNCIFSKTPFCVSVRNDYDSYFWYMKILSRLTYKKANLVVCQTDAMEKTVKKAVNCNTTVIWNPLDPDAYVSEPFKGERRKVIFNVGRLMPQKNQKLLIEAFSRVAEEFPDYELHIYGTGELQSELQNLIDNKGLHDRAFLKGVVPNAVAKNYDASLFVMSSDFEGFPNTLAEALANGIPAISTDFGTKAARILLKEGECGTLVPVGDILEMEQAIRNVLQHYDLALEKAENGMYIRNSLDPDSICEEWLNKIQETLA